MSKPLFSVIVPAHNAEEFIEKGLHSIKMQTFTDYELIVVCDRCTDRTAEIAAGYADKVLIRDFGLDGLARNAGIEAAEGEWLLFMDHDDWFLHEFVFQQIADAIKARSTDCLDVLLFDFIWKGRRYHSQLRNGAVIAVWSKCWRREFVGDTRFSDLPHWSDVGFARAMWDKCPVYAFMNYPVYYYNYLMPGSISWREKQGEIEGYKEG